MPFSLTVKRKARVAVSLAALGPFASLSSSQENTPSNPVQFGTDTPSPDSAAPTVAPQIYTVSGTVLNSVTHQPIAHALVNGQQDAVLTDNEGRFELHLPAGVATISPQRPGYNGPGAMFQFSEFFIGADLSDLVLPLRPETIITGQVTLPDSDSADGISVMAYRRAVMDGRPVWEALPVKATNSDGKFRIPQLQPGAYLLYTQPERDRDAPQTPGHTESGYIGTYYPGVADSDAAGILTVAAGQQAQADFTLVRKPFHPVTVKVANPDAGRVVGFQLCDVGGRPMELPMQQNREQGTLQFAVPSGRYYIETRSGSFGPLGAEGGVYGRVDFTVAGAALPILSLTLLPLHAISVNVHKDFTATQGAAAGDIAPLISQEKHPEFNAGLYLTLTPADEPFRFAFGYHGLSPVKGATDGTSFQLTGVAPGKYWVTPLPFQGYVSSITSGGADLYRDPLIVGPGGSSAPIEVTLRDDAGNLSVKFDLEAGATGGVNASPASGNPPLISIYAVPLFPHSGPLPALNFAMMKQGESVMSNLRPGAYRVIAFDRPREIEFATTEGLAKYSSMGQPVTIEAGATAHVELNSVETGGEGSE